MQTFNASSTRDKQVHFDAADLLIDSRIKCDLDPHLVRLVEAGDRRAWLKGRPQGQKITAHENGSHLPRSQVLSNPEAGGSNQPPLQKAADQIDQRLPLFFCGIRARIPQVTCPKPFTTLKFTSMLRRTTAA